MLVFDNLDSVTLNETEICENSARGCCEMRLRLDSVFSVHKRLRRRSEADFADLAVPVFLRQMHPRGTAALLFNLMMLHAPPTSNQICWYRAEGSRAYFVSARSRMRRAFVFARFPHPPSPIEHHLRLFGLDRSKNSARQTGFAHDLIRLASGDPRISTASLATLDKHADATPVNKSSTSLFTDAPSDESCAIAGGTAAAVLISCTSPFKGAWHVIRATATR